MKTIFLVMASVIPILPLYGQYGFQWGKVDTVTTGENDDMNPVLPHGGIIVGNSLLSQWLLFERHTDGISAIVGKKFFFRHGAWDSAEVTISRAPGFASERNPEVSEAPMSRAGEFQTFHLAAWERKEDSIWNIYYSYLTHGDSSWSPPQPFTKDSVDNTGAQIRPLSDSTFIIVWKRKSLVLCSLVNPAAVSMPETIAVGTSDSVEFDIATGYGEGLLVYTSRDTAGKNIMISRRLETYPTFTISPPETLFFRQSAFKPRLMAPIVWYKVVFFETVIDRDREVFVWEGDHNSDHRVENISNDPLADDRNPRAFANPVITAGSVGEGFVPYNDVVTIEKCTASDSALIFLHAQYFSDTVRSSGFNRNACIGSRMFFSDGSLHILTVWESNRSGRSHIYARTITFPVDDVREQSSPPRSFTLQQNYPNPFNPVTTIRFSIAEARAVSLRIYDVLGREVAMLVNERLGPGDYVFRWDASKYSSGVYVYRLKAGDFVKSRKMLIVR